jgi:DNA transposition AAA+ family ATPase
MIIAPTGLGKTNAVDVFVNKNPLHTYRITVARYYKLEDILDELISRLGIEANDSIAKRMDGRSIKRRIDKIVNKLIEIKYAGGNPMIILDESENLIVSVLQTIKGLYDALVNNCALVMIGTEQLLEGLLNTRTRNRTSVPQLYRRFKANTLYVSKLNKKIDFKPFFDEYVTDKGLQTLLCALCDNYGELHDYLEPTLKECGSKNIELTEEFFRLKWNENRFQIVRA